MLRKELNLLRTQAKKDSHSAAQNSTPQDSVARRSAAEVTSRAPAMHTEGLSKPRPAQSTGLGESGLPTPSLPVSPQSPADPPKGGLSIVTMWEIAS